MSDQEAPCGPRISTDGLEMRLTEADCSFREISFEDRSTLGLGPHSGLARTPSVQVMSLGDVTARFCLKSGNLKGNAIFVSSLFLVSAFIEGCQN